MAKALGFCGIDFQSLTNSARVLNLPLIMGMTAEDGLWISKRIDIAATNISGDFSLQRSSCMKGFRLCKIPRLQFLAYNPNQCPILAIPGH